MSTHGPDNRNGEPLDKGLEDVGQAYGRLEREQPPELLDQAILNKARREVEARPHWMQFGWLHGLTTAAVVVLAFSIVLNQRDYVPVEEGIEFDSSETMLQTAPAPKGVEQQLAPGEGVEYHAVRKAATAPAEDIPGDDQDVHPEATVDTVQRQARKSAGVSALDALDAGAATEEAIVLDEVVSEETSFMAVSAPATAVVAEPETAPADAAEEKQQRDRQAEEDAEQRLLEIMRLKMVGDESWRKALEAFVEDYPDYPLPHELRD